MRRFRTDEILLWGAVALAFAPALAALAERWIGAEYYQHGFLVPLVSLGIAHPLLRRMGPPRREPRALLGLAAAVAGLALGVATGSATLQGLALVAALSALVGHRWGAAGMRRLAFPLAFLLFMVPLPESWLFPVIVGLQGWVSVASVALLHAIGVAVAREGNVIRLANGDALFVAEACSGITSLVSLLPIGVLIARYTQDGLGRRLALVASVVPAALLCNGIRVVATVLAADRVGVERATSGPLHDSAGLLTSSFAVLLVIGFGAWIGRRPADPVAA